MQLAGGAERGLPVVVEYHQAVFVAAEAVLDQVADNDGDLLVAALLFRVVGEVFAFGGKADAQWRFGQRGDFGEDVRIEYELDRGRCVAVLFDLLLAFQI